MAATNFAQIRGDEAGLRIRLSSTGAVDLEFASGAFLGSPEEERIITMFLETTDGATKSFSLKATIFDPRFPAMSLVGKMISSTKRAIEDII